MARMSKPEVIDLVEDGSEVVGSEGGPPQEPPAVAVKSTALRCPFCLDSVEASKKSWVACAGCLARHHRGCWRESKRCASCGSTKHLVAPKEPNIPAGRGVGRGVAPGGRILATTHRLLAHEAHIRAIALWNVLGAVLVAFMALLLMLAAQGARSDTGVVGFLFLLGAFGLFATGLALWSYVPWARWATLAINSVGLVLVLYVASMERAEGVALLKMGFNIAWSAATAWALVAKPANGIFHPSYKMLLDRDREQRPRWYLSPFFAAPWVVAIVSIAYVVSRR